MAKKRDAEWATRLMLDGHQVETVPIGNIYRLRHVGRQLQLQRWSHPRQSWERCVTGGIPISEYRIAAPGETRPEPTTAAGTCAEVPEGYERWEGVRVGTPDRGDMPEFREPGHPVGQAGYEPLATIHAHPRFGFFVFEKVDDDGTLHRLYRRDLHVVWNKTRRCLCVDSVGTIVAALAEVEVVDPVAVLMRP